MQRDGVIGKYAIGGAVGATFYLEPVATFDVDIFVVLPTAGKSSLLSLAPIYDYLKSRGGVVEEANIVALRTGRSKDHLRIVQFLEQDAVDRDRLNAVLARHQLAATWEKFRGKYLEK